MTTPPKKVWLVTGASSVLGREIVQAALSRGDNVIATARDPAKVTDLASDSCKILQLDVTDEPEVIQGKATEALKFWGRVDVLVNNAALTLLGPVEELGYNGLKAQYDTVVFGTIKVTNAFLPSMRERQSGIVVMIGSRTAWQAASPMSGFYASSKAALHALAETLSAELSFFKIRVLLVEPGAMRTTNLKSAIQFSSSFPRKPIASYVPFWAQGQKQLENQNGKQPGDPTKAANAIVDVVRDEGSAKGRSWPSLLALGKDAQDNIRGKCHAIVKTLDEWADVGAIEF